MTHETTGGFYARANGRKPRRRSRPRTDSLITSDPNVLGGSPVIAGTPIRVADVIGSMDYMIDDPARAIYVLGSITTPQFEAAMTYWRQHPLEIEAEIAEDRFKRRLN
jgi:uncharacterized protein (DUF433 family)